MALIKKAKPADAIDPEEAEAAIDDEPLAELEPDESEDVADAETMAALAAVPADPVEAETPAAGGADSLLDMFSAVGLETVDRTLLVGLAGEVLIEDLISELNLVAAALGVVRDQHEARLQEEEQQLAA